MDKRTNFYVPNPGMGGQARVSLYRMSEMFSLYNTTRVTLNGFGLEKYAQYPGCPVARFKKKGGRTFLQTIDSSYDGNYMLVLLRGWSTPEIVHPWVEEKGDGFSSRKLQVDGEWMTTHDPKLRQHQLDAMTDLIAKVGTDYLLWDTRTPETRYAPSVDADAIVWEPEAEAVTA